MSVFKRKNKECKPCDEREPVLVASITSPLFSELFQDMLKENGIPFICRQRGAGGYIKILTGGLLVADNIYVNYEDYEKAIELYNLYINSTDFNLNEDN